MPFSSRRTPRSGHSSDRDDTISVISVQPNNDGSDYCNLDLSDSISPNVSSGENTLTAHDINYYVKIPTRLWEKDKKLQILANITGIYKPGLNAILGNFGAGKTSLLKVLSGRADKDFVDGTFLLNGHIIPGNFKSHVGFVPQNDILQGSLTVRENLSFSASLRLPSCLTKSERDERVSEVIKDLELEKSADLKAGTTYIRGVTPGIRKLCSIGMELVISPPVLFLDEPTTFLDPITANMIIMYLKRLSNQRRTIIFSINQPRYTAYRLFDNISLLASGNTIFHGSPKDALEFFNKQGFKCPTHNNPADFFMEVINADQTSIAEYCMRANPRHGQRNSIVEPSQVYDCLIIQGQLIREFITSSWCANLLHEAADVYAMSERRQCTSAASATRATSQQQAQKNTFERYPTSIVNQIFVMSAKNIRNLILDPERSIKTLATTLVLSIMMMGIYWQLEDDPITGFSDRAGVLFFLVLVQLFFNISSLDSYFRERLILLHEHKSGLYRISTYVFVKIICDILLLRILSVALMSIAVYFAVGLRNDSESFFLFFLCLLLVTVTTAGVAFLVASTFETFAIGQVTMSLVFMLMMVFSGYMINLGSLELWITWVQYLSLIKYGLTALYIIEFQDRTFCSRPSDNTTCKFGNSYLSELDMEFESGWDLGKNYLALVLLSIAFFGLSYIQLRRMAAR